MISLERLGPVLKPAHEYQAKFNAGMVRVGDTVHMLYRFAEKRPRWYGRSIDWTEWTAAGGEFPYLKNCICYATLDTKGALLHDTGTVVLEGLDSWESAGCEDARIVPFEGAFYIFYSAVSISYVRPAIARTTDFISFERLGVIDHFTYDKDTFIFPERIGGKIAFVHRILPSMQLDYFDSFEQLVSPEAWVDYAPHLEESTFLRGAHAFEARKIGGGVPPIRTERGWLLIYHGVDQSGIYHTAVALLDLENPRIVRARLPYPVLSPQADFEICGDYDGCVFAMGYFLDHDTLYISYGTADRYTAMARTSLSALLAELERFRS